MPYLCHGCRSSEKKRNREEASGNSATATAMSGKGNMESNEPQHQTSLMPTPAALAAEASAALNETPRRLPTKLLYDDRGSELFDQICRTPEYYPTRTELKLLEDFAEDVVQETDAGELLELGAGMARKTHLLLSALSEQNDEVHYLPMDISASALEEARRTVKKTMPKVNVQPVVGDYTRPLPSPPRNAPRMMAFLGSTIGNFTPEDGDKVMENTAACLAEGEWFLLGTDLVKPIDVLEAAYNDAAGVTAAFNKNILTVTNRLLDGDFQEDDFEHVAFFNEKASQIEIHLEAKRRVEVQLKATEQVLRFESGERIATEVSRKFTRPGVEALLDRNGYKMDGWFPSHNEYYALSLARRK